MGEHTNIRVYERANVYPQSIAYYLQLMHSSPKKYPFISNAWEVMTFLHDDIWWARDVDYLKNVFSSWLRGWLKSAAKRKQIFSLYQNDYKKMVSRFLALKNIELGRVSNSDLLKTYHEAVALAFKHISYAEYTTDLFDDFFAKLFAEELEKKGIKLSPDEFSQIIRPATKSASAKYHDLLASKNKLDFKKIVEKYSWIKMSWDGKNELTEKDVEKDLLAAFRLVRQAHHKVTLRVSASKKHILRFRRGFKKWIGWFILLDNFNMFHDYRKEIQMRANQIIYRVLREIPKRFPIAYNDLVWYMNDEVENLLANGRLPSAQTLKKRQSGTLWLIQSGKIKEYFGKDAEKKLDELVLSKLVAQKTKDFKGLPASRGKIKGRVFVAKNAGEANVKMKKGQILVTSMTTIDYLPAMRRAGGIITDDGGATCHAAIVSRELGVPCVVGTKVATQVLKTGDVVEVDGGAGVVKVIQK